MTTQKLFVRVEYGVVQATAGQTHGGTCATGADGELGTSWTGRKRKPTFAQVKREAGSDTDALKKSERHT
jgi:hypothetical protein